MEMATLTSHVQLPVTIKPLEEGNFDILALPVELLQFIMQKT